MCVLEGPSSFSLQTQDDTCSFPAKSLIAIYWVKASVVADVLSSCGDIQS